MYTNSSQVKEFVVCLGRKNSQLFSSKFQLKCKYSDVFRHLLPSSLKIHRDVKFIEIINDEDCFFKKKKKNCLARLGMINIHFRIRLRELYSHPYQDIMSITEWFPVYARLKYNISLCLCGIVSKFILEWNGYGREMRFVLLCRVIRVVGSSFSNLNAGKTEGT